MTPMLGHGVLDGLDTVGDQAVRVGRAGADRVLDRAVDIGKQGDHRDAQAVGLLRGLGGGLGRQAEDAGHGRRPGCGPRRRHGRSAARSGRRASGSSRRPDGAPRGWSAGGAGGRSGKAAGGKGRVMAVV